MFLGFYMVTQDTMGEAICPDGWSGMIKKDTPIALTYFDEYGMEFTTGEKDKNGIEKEFRFNKPCPIVAASTCYYCGKIVWTPHVHDHMQKDINCKRIRKDRVISINKKEKINEHK